MSDRIHFITLGCAKNEVDTDKMKALLLSAGYSIVDDIDESDLIVVNTCSFLASAVEEGIDVIFDVLGDEAHRSKVLVTGCMPSRYGENLTQELPEVAGFLAADQEDDVVNKVDEILGNQSSLCNGMLRATSAASAYVKISDGCDRFCSYCMIPYIRGRYHSYPAEDILVEVGELVAKGTREIVFIGQDTGIWGRDFDVPSSIADLLREASDRFPDTWFRLLYIQPEGINDDLLSLMRERENICSYLDIPLQHVDAQVLRNMNRTGDPESLAQLLAHIRLSVPDVCIRTTLMAGFPGETLEQHQELLDFVQENPFDYAGVFAYSQEEGSKAAEREDQLDEEEKIQRAQAVLDLCDQCGYSRAAGRIGETHLVLVEDYEETDAGVEALARMRGQAPEVDGQVHIPLEEGQALEVGQLVQVKIVDSFCYELVGELL